MKELAVAATLILCACSGGERMTNAPQAGDTVQIPAMEWRVVDREGLMKVYRNSGLDTPQGQQLEGFAGVDGSGANVIYTLPPRTVDDQVTCTLGHEVLHVALGKYHKEQK